MNIILHDFPTAKILSGNTLAAPKFKDGERLRTYDYVVANPPFSDKTWSTGLVTSRDQYQRFEWGVPPGKQGDYAYLLHIVRAMKSSGKAACILPHGVLFRGNAEAIIRRQLVRSGILKGIIGLPANLFFGTGIPACILVLDKENARARRGIFMIDAARGFIKDGNKNRLREQDVHRIVDTFVRVLDVPRYARMVSFEEIADAKNDYNLNLPRYIDSSEAEDVQDIMGHLRGGIPERDLDDAVKLGPYWAVLPGVRAALFAPERPGYARLQLPIAQVKTAVFEHPEFSAFNATATATFARWKDECRPQLVGFGKDKPPKPLIEAIAEALLTAFKAPPLLDAYDIYQHLMDYWAATMQDDCYLIAAEGWCDAARLKLISADKNAKEKPDFVVGRKKYRAELIPPALIVARYFASEQTEIEQRESAVAALQQQLEELAEEHSGEGGLLEDAKNDKDKLTKASVTARRKAIKDDAEAEEERAVLDEYLALSERETEASSALKRAQEKLTEKVFFQYGKLTEDEIKTLVVEDKWLATIAAAVQGELDRVSQTLTGRIGQFAQRYATPLPELVDALQVLADDVEGHLQKMGATWK